MGSLSGEFAKPLSSQVIDTDLDCARCGYNLRTLAWSAACPECLTPVASSRLPAGFLVKSHGEIRRLRLPWLVLIASVILETLCHIQYVLACRFWLQLIELGHRPLLRMSVRIWNYGRWLSGGFIEPMAIILLGGVFLRYRIGSKARLPKIMIALAFLSAFETARAYAVDLFFPTASLSNSNWFVSHVIGWLLWALGCASLLARPLYLLIALLLMRSLIEKGRRRGVSMATFLGIVAAGLMLCGPALEVLYTVAVQILSTTGHDEITGRSFWVLSPQLQWVYQARDLADWWHRRMDTACWFVMLVSVALFFRTWDRARRTISSSAVTDQ